MQRINLRKFVAIATRNCTSIMLITLTRNFFTYAEGHVFMNSLMTFVDYLSNNQLSR
jgi:hypothetical protein